MSWPGFFNLWLFGSLNIVQKSVTPKITAAPRNAETRLAVSLTSACTISTPLDCQDLEAEEEILRDMPLTFQPGV